MDDLVQDLIENGYDEHVDWLISDGELWVSPFTALFIIESNPMNELLINVWEPDVSKKGNVDRYR